MQSIESIASAHRANERWRRNRARSYVCEIAELVLGDVHPSNLGALPPAPRVLVYKAAQIGLMTDREASELLVRADL